MRWARTWTSRRPGHGCGPAGGVTAYGGAWRGLIAWDGSALPGRWWHAQAGGSNRSSDYHLPTAPCLYVRVQGGVTGVGSEPAAAGRGGACACAEWSGLISGLSVGCGAVHAGLAGRAGAGGRERRLGRRGCVHPAEQRPDGDVAPRRSRVGELERRNADLAEHNTKLERENERVRKEIAQLRATVAAGEAQLRDLRAQGGRTRATRPARRRRTPPRYPDGNGTAGACSGSGADSRVIPDTVILPSRSRRMRRTCTATLSRAATARRRCHRPCAPRWATR
jgi:hypothetical protein